MNLTWQTITPATTSQPIDAGQVAETAINRSHELQAFFDAAANTEQPILLLINDPHRSTQTRPVLEALARLIERTTTDSPGPGQTHEPPDAPLFDVLVATGTHHFEPDERRTFEQATLANCGLDIRRVAWHDADDVTLIDLAGIRINRMIAGARFLLPIGSVEPHYFAGLTGPHKTVTIGCMGRADIERNHQHALHPDSDILKTTGNPVHEEVHDILNKLKTAGKNICAVAQVVRGDNLLELAIGDPIDTVNALTPTVKRVYVHTIAQPADLLHLKVPLPLGRNFYQADKALKNNHRAVRDGGGIILEAACPEGVGQDAFMNLLRRADSYSAALKIVGEEGYRLGDHKAVKLHYLTDPARRGVRVAIVSPTLASTMSQRSASHVDTDDSASPLPKVGHRGVDESANATSSSASPAETDDSSPSPLTKGGHRGVDQPNNTGTALEGTGLAVFATVDEATAYLVATQDHPRSPMNNPTQSSTPNETNHPTPRGLIIEDAAMMCVIPDAK